MTDAELVEQARAGDQAAFGVLVDRYQHVVYRAARSLAWHAPREHQMLNAAINRITSTGVPPVLQIQRWSEVAHLHESRDELLA